ncbi:hypothetical protein GW17_00012767 [Ensete ventricosum]|nr:hypothetical protein GW17_00012767 [Ensete ventricosum]
MLAFFASVTNTHTFTFSTSSTITGGTSVANNSVAIAATVSCSVPILLHDFANAVGAPPIHANYEPPLNCPGPWSRVILELSGSASDVQTDRIAAVWLGGAEILRTTTPLPMAPGAVWHVHKDITRYTSLLHIANSFSMMLDNSITTLPGV